MKIVLIDDDLIIREAVKSAFSILEDTLSFSLDVYTAENGAEGLGLVYVTKADVIVIDLTLPKYSGKEVLEYIINNHGLNPKTKQIILLHENDDYASFRSPKNISLINKSKNDFTIKLVNSITTFYHLEGKKFSSIQKIKLRLVNRVIIWGNYLDIVSKRLFTGGLFMKIVFLIPWIVIQIMGGCILH
ncbi:MAG: response regulator [Candidatus Dojkabacteria bacterium]|nr:response regulator [Candidatus Dojkabacteria bacterium]